MRSFLYRQPWVLVLAQTLEPHFEHNVRLQTYEVIFATAAQSSCLHRQTTKALGVSHTRGCAGCPCSPALGQTGRVTAGSQALAVASIHPPCPTERPGRTARHFCCRLLHDMKVQGIPAADDRYPCPVAGCFYSSLGSASGGLAGFLTPAAACQHLRKPRDEAHQAASQSCTPVTEAEHEDRQAQKRTRSAELRRARNKRQRIREQQREQPILSGIRTEIASILGLHDKQATVRFLQDVIVTKGECSGLCCLLASKNATDHFMSVCSLPLCSEGAPRICSGVACPRKAS